MASRRSLKWALDNCTAEGQIIRPPGEQLDDKVYADMKRHFTDNRGKWKGGKKQYFEFPKNAEQLLADLQAGKTPKFKRDSHFFYTPKEVVNEMCNMHILIGPHRILEPSAGQGHLIEAVNDFVNLYPEKHDWVTIEADEYNREVLAKKGYPPVHDDFDTFETDERFEVCYANPPFKKDTDHVVKIVSLLAKGGAAVIVLPDSWPYRDKRNKELMKEFEESFESVGVRKLPSDAFKETGTGVNTVLLILKYKKHD